MSRDEKYHIQKSENEDGKSTTIMMKTAASIIEKSYGFAALDPYYAVLEPEMKELIRK